MTDNNHSRVSKVLVTGATGFIGKNLCEYLLASGFSVRALIKDENSPVLNPNRNLEQCFGDLLDQVSLKKVCKNVDFVVHLAGLAHVSQSTSEQFYETNVCGTESLLAAAIEAKVKRFVFMSSSLASLAESEGAATTTYGRAKLAAEKSVMSQHCDGNIECVVLRPVNVYGRGMRGNIATLVSLVSKRLAPPLPRLRTLISLVSVEDVCEATRLSIISEKACGKIYTLTDGIQYVISDIEKAIYGQFGRRVPKWQTPRLLLYISCMGIEYIGKFLCVLGIRFSFLSSLGIKTYHNLVEDNLFGNDKIIEELGFNPKTTFYCSLPKIVEGLNCRSTEIST